MSAIQLAYVILAFCALSSYSQVVVVQVTKDYLKAYWGRELQPSFLFTRRSLVLDNFFAVPEKMGANLEKILKRKSPFTGNDEQISEVIFYLGDASLQGNFNRVQKSDLLEQYALDANLLENHYLEDKLLNQIRASWPSVKVRFSDKLSATQGAFQDLSAAHKDSVNVMLSFDQDAFIQEIWVPCTKEMDCNSQDFVKTTDADLLLGEFASFQTTSSSSEVVLKYVHDLLNHLSQNVFPNTKIAVYLMGQELQVSSLQQPVNIDKIHCQIIPLSFDYMRRLMDGCKKGGEEFTQISSLFYAVSDNSNLEQFSSILRTYLSAHSPGDVIKELKELSRRDGMPKKFSAIIVEAFNRLGHDERRELINFLFKALGPDFIINDNNDKYSFLHMAVKAKDFNLISQYAVNNVRFPQMIFSFSKDCIVRALSLDDGFNNKWLIVKYLADHTNDFQKELMGNLAEIFYNPGVFRPEGHKLSEILMYRLHTCSTSGDFNAMQKLTQIVGKEFVATHGKEFVMDLVKRGDGRKLCAFLKIGFNLVIRHNAFDLGLTLNNDCRIQRHASFVMIGHFTNQFKCERRNTKDEIEKLADERRKGDSYAVSIHQVPNGQQEFRSGLDHWKEELRKKYQEITAFDLKIDVDKPLNEQNIADWAPFFEFKSFQYV